MAILAFSLLDLVELPVPLRQRQPLLDLVLRNPQPLQEVQAHFTVEGRVEQCVGLQDVVERGQEALPPFAGHLGFVHASSSSSRRLDTGARRPAIVRWRGRVLVGGGPYRQSSCIRQSFP